MLNTPSPAGFNSTRLTRGKNCKHGCLVKAQVFPSPALWNTCLPLQWAKPHLSFLERQKGCFLQNNHNFLHMKWKHVKEAQKGIIAERSIFLVESFVMWGRSSQHHCVSVMLRSEEFVLLGEHVQLVNTVQRAWREERQLKHQKETEGFGEGAAWQSDALAQDSAGKGPAFW